MSTERTLLIVKPDGVANGYTAPIIDRLNQAGLKIVGEYNTKFTKEQAQEFYFEEHKDKPYFAGLYLFMSSGPIVVLDLEGEDVVKKVRALIGATKPENAEPGTIRHDFKSAGGPCNVVHASDSYASYLRELPIATIGVVD